MDATDTLFKLIPKKKKNRENHVETKSIKMPLNINFFSFYFFFFLYYFHFVLSLLSRKDMQFEKYSISARRFSPILNVSLPFLADSVIHQLKN